jgi:hypothetical protein
MRLRAHNTHHKGGVMDDLTLLEQKSALYDTISDLSKDRQGFRERFDWRSWSLEDLRARYEYWASQPLDDWD